MHENNLPILIYKLNNTKEQNPKEKSNLIRCKWFKNLRVNPQEQMIKRKIQKNN
jgi:hypothetical protein